MQKKIIALAVAAVASSAAFAQSNVSVYGIVDMYAGQFASNGTTSSVVNSGGLAGSRLGFKGVEDLGNGTKALFTLEYALNPDRNAGVGSPDATYAGAATGAAAPAIASSTQTRQASIGLTGSAGTVLLGRLPTMVYNHNAAFNPTFGTAVDTLHTIAGKVGSSMGTQERLDNAVAYVAPAFGGVTISGAYTAAASGTESTSGIQADTRAAELAADYVNGALAVGFVVRQVLNTGSVSTGNLGTQLGASYDFGVAKLFATAGSQANSQDIAGTSSNDSRANVANYGLTAPVSAAGTVILSQGNAVKSSADQNWTQTALVYKHALSKRTAVYGGIANQKSSGNGASDVATLGTVSSGSTGNVTGVLAGINHAF